MKRKKIYLDGAANAPLDPKVLKAMAPYMSRRFQGNSHSQHGFGAVADLAVTNAREQIAKALKVKPEEVLFTSGATEANNWVIKSLALAELAKPEADRKTTIVCSAIEHASVINACESLKPLGFSIVYVNPCPSSGEILVGTMARAIKKAGRVLLACCMVVNNETGVENRVDEMAVYAHRNGALFLADITQGMLYGKGHIEIGTLFPHVDFLSLSSHKIYGPTGVGCLIKREDVRLDPLIHGGSQEFGLRGGTHNVAGIVGMGKAVSLLAERDYAPLYESMYDILCRLLVTSFPQGVGPQLYLNAAPTHKNIVSLSCCDAISLPDIASALDSYGIACSAGAACSSGSEGQHPSHVLQAMGRTEKQIRCTVRVSFTKFTTEGDILALAAALKDLSKRFSVFPGQARAKEGAQ